MELENKKINISFKNITKRFGNNIANNNISFDIFEGEILALLGENGSGKTTLMNMLSGIYFPDEGDIFVHGEKANIKSPHDAFKYNIGMIHQHFKLIDTFTCLENIVLGIEDKNKSKLKIAKELVNEILSKYGFVLDLNRKVYEMSVSEKQTLEIVKALYRGANTLILDEPTAGLDPGGRDEIFDLIKRLHEESNMTIILSSHSMDDMSKIAKTIIVMNHGKIEFMGTPREIFNNHAPRLREIGLDIPQVLELAIKLKDKGFDIRTDVLTIDEIKEEVLNFMKGRKRC